MDNILKTLFDGLRIPKLQNEITSDLDFEYCLLEDDSLIEALQVRTHRIFEENTEDVFYIHFEPIKTEISYENIGL